MAILNFNGQFLKMKMKDEYKKIKKQLCISIFFSYCIYFYDICLIHLLINEITQGWSPYTSAELTIHSSMLGQTLWQCFVHGLRMRWWRIDREKVTAFLEDVYLNTQQGDVHLWWSIPLHHDTAHHYWLRACLPLNASWASRNCLLWCLGNSLVFCYYLQNR